MLRKAKARSSFKVTASVDTCIQAVGASSDGFSSARNQTKNEILGPKFSEFGKTSFRGRKTDPIQNGGITHDYQLPQQINISID